jgi:hypothetical protein
MIEYGMPQHVMPYSTMSASRMVKQGSIRKVTKSMEGPFPVKLFQASY